MTQKKIKKTTLLYSRAVISLNQHTMQVFKTCGTVCAARIVFIIFGRPVIETVISATVIKRAKVVHLARGGRKERREIIEPFIENNIGTTDTFQVSGNSTFLGFKERVEVGRHFVSRVRHG